MAGPTPLVAARSLCLAAEGVFGPQVGSACLNGFDFTLLFEESIMSIPLSALFILSVPPRLIKLFNEPQKALGGPLYLAKLLFWAVAACGSLVLTALWSLPGAQTTQTTIAASSLAAFAAILAAVLSHMEHMRSLRPSKVLEIYLLLAAALDLARIRTLFGLDNSRSVAALFTALWAVKFLLLVLESWPKNKWLKPLYRHAPKETTSGLVNRVLFWWLNPQLLTGYSKDLGMDDLLDIDQGLATQTSHGQTLTQRWAANTAAGKSSSLTMVCLKQYKLELLAGIFPRAVQIAFTFAQPFLIRSTVILVASPLNETTKSQGYALIAAFAIVYTGIAISTVTARHKAFRVITMMRDSIVAMIYDKTLELSLAGLDRKGPATLMSADIERLASGIRYVHDVWANCIEIALALYLLYAELGVSGVAPIVIAFGCALFAIIISALSRSRQKAWLEAIEARVEATSTMLNSMKMVKLRGLTNKLHDIVYNMKEDEIHKSLKFRNLLIAAAAVAYSNGTIAPVVSFAIFTEGYNGVLTTDIAFYSLTLFALLNEPIGSLVESATGLASSIGSLERIEKFLRTPPHQSGRHVHHEKTAIVARQRTVGWDETAPTICDLDFKIQPATFTMIVGPTGSGKSTLINTILGEIPFYKGYLGIADETVAYCAQNPFIINDTLRRNVLGESLYEVNWYNTVIRACGLERDCQVLQKGDQTVLGSNGNALSGGQKQRVAVARAVYSRKSTVILDDPFSGLDPTTEEMVISSLFGPDGLFRKMHTTVIMATNAVHRVSVADHIIVLGPDGQVAQQGTFKELQASNADFVDTCLNPANQAPSEPAAAAAVPTVNDLPEVMETSSEGDRRSGDMSLYLYYVKTVGIWNALFFVFLMVIYVFFLTFPTIWIQWWSNENDINPNHELGMYLGVYAFLAACSFGAILGAAWHLMHGIVSAAARKLHRRLLSTVLGAPASFFSANDIGVTTNRFTQDLQLIDMELPISLLNTLLAGLTCVAQLGIIAYSTKFLAAIIPFVIAVFYFIQKFYLRTSRQLRFMEIEIKSPLFTNILETISGLTTIRAFGWKKVFQERNQALVENSQKPFYLLFCIQRWLELVVSLAVGGIAVVLVGVAVSQIGTSNASFIGVALVNIVTFSGNIQQLIMHWTILETTLGAVARIRSFTEETETENKPEEKEEPPASWPSTGRIEFRNVSASYKKDNSKLCLNQVSFGIAGGKKIGVCGRSGSGKSTLVSTMLRLLDTCAGSIVVDGVDLATLPRQTIRERMIVIPQEPYFYPGTVRDNLDPTGAAGDNEVIAALQRTQIWDAVMKHGGLDAAVTEDFLSFGQRQLLCLAGAMLRRGEKILVLDEASSGVDKASDALMQKIIRTDFKDHTILAIAHRLDTIIDFDQVLVLDAGVLVESGNPSELLRTVTPSGQPSRFRALYDSMRSDRSSASSSTLSGPNSTSLGSISEKPLPSSPSDDAERRRQTLRASKRMSRMELRRSVFRRSNYLSASAPRMPGANGMSWANESWYVDADAETPMTPFFPRTPAGPPKTPNRQTMRPWSGMWQDWFTG